MLLEDCDRGVVAGGFDGEGREESARRTTWSDESNGTRGSEKRSQDVWTSNHSILENHDKGRTPCMMAHQHGLRARKILTCETKDEGGVF